MGIFDLFKKPATIEDDYFGKLRLVTSKDSSKNYFECKVFFAPTNSETECFIIANGDHPSSEQKQFLKNFQINFEEYVQKIKSLIVDEFRNWKEDFKIVDFNKEFTLVAVTIPRLGGEPIKWDISFSTIHDPNHHILIDFEEMEPVGILIDG